MDDLFEQLLSILQRLQNCDEMHEDDAAVLHSMELDAKATYELSMDRRLRSAGINPDASDDELAEVAAALTGEGPKDPSKWN